MAIDIGCDNCYSHIERGEELFCKDCMDEKNDTITQLESDFTELENEVSELKEKLEDLERERRT